MKKHIDNIALVGGAFLWAAALALVVFLMLTPLRALAVEVFAGSGSQRWMECGDASTQRDGCWQQRGIGATQFEMGGRAAHIGVRLGEFEVTAQDFATIRAEGRFVPDANYDSDAHRVIGARLCRDDEDCRCLRTMHQRITQNSAALAFEWAPRWTFGSAWVQTNLGVARFRHHIDTDGGGWTMHLSQRKWAPSGALRVAYDLGGGVTLAAYSKAYWQPRSRDTIGGGGGASRIGLKTYGVEVRYGW